MRLMWLYEILLKEADAEHPISTNALIERLWSTHGIRLHRVTLTKDLELLRESGIDIVTTRTKGYNYHIGERLFELGEVKLLIDAVEASKFITKRRTKVLEKKLTTLVSMYQAESLKRSLYNCEKVKSENEQGMKVVDAIHAAINTGKKISFYYTDYSIKRRRILKNHHKPYIVSPYQLICNGDFYYLVGFNHQREKVNVFRVDRIAKEPEVLLEAAEPMPEEFDLSRYTKQVFRMYATDDPVEVTLRCQADVMKGLVDKFGPRVWTRPVSDQEFVARVSVCTSPTFYAWVFQWGGKVRITEPKFVAEEYQRMLRGQVEE